MENKAKTDYVPAVGKIVNKNVGSDVRMLVVEVDRRKYPIENFKWGKWNYKISNFEHVKHKIKEGDVVEGALFRFLLHSNPKAAFRFHIKSVIPATLSSRHN